MKADLAEKIRNNLITQALIVILCISFSSGRQSQTKDIQELETLYVSYRMLTATAGDVRNNDTDEKLGSPENIAATLEAHMTKAKDIPEVDALALFIANAKPSFNPPSHRMPLPSGGWLRFHADRESYKELGPPPVPGAPPLYELTLVVSEDAELHQDETMRVTLTNAEQSFNSSTHQPVWESMRLRAKVSGVDEPMAPADIENRIRLKARSWSNAVGSVDTLYATARYSYENEEINIPIINTQVSASLALAALALVSTALAAYGSHQCRMAGKIEGSEEHQGFLILRPKEGTVEPGWWHILLAQIEVLFVQPPYWTGLLAPVVCAGILALAHSDIAGWWLGWILLPLGISYSWLLARALVGVTFTRSDGNPPASGLSAP